LEAWVDANVPVRTVHASRGKIVRAELVSALYEQGKVHHVGDFPELEDQPCSLSRRIRLIDSTGFFMRSLT
jgi:phage terminase large subunit-like protein